MSKKRILLIYTGGTIGMVASEDGRGLVPFDFSHLKEEVPELRKLNAQVDIEAFDEPIDSSNMTPKIWAELAQIIYDRYGVYDGFVLLHGSDTMAYTASALSFMLQGLKKPVVFTGSQLPIDSVRTDGKENLITSIEIASLDKSGEPQVQEVAIHFEDNLYRGNRTSKVNAEDFEAFESYNFPLLAEVGVRIKMNTNVLYRSKLSQLVLHKEFCSDVLILKLFPGLTQATLQHIMNTPNLKGVVLETFGSGNASNEDWFLNELRKANDKGIIIVNVSQCHGGTVEQGLYETSSGLIDAGVVDGSDITTESAVCKLMYLLSLNLDFDTLKKQFVIPVAGEMTAKSNLSLEN